MNLKTIHFTQLLAGKTLQFYNEIDIQIQGVQHYVSDTNHMTVQFDILSGHTEGKTCLYHDSVYVKTDYLSDDHIGTVISEAHQDRVISDIVDAIDNDYREKIYHLGVRNVINHLQFEIDRMPSQDDIITMQSPDMSVDQFQTALYGQSFTTKDSDTIVIRDTDIKYLDIDLSQIHCRSLISDDYSQFTIEFTVDMTPANPGRLSKHDQRLILNRIAQAIDTYNQTVDMPNYINDKINAIVQTKFLKS